MQEGIVIAYASNKIQPHEENCTTDYLELVVIVHTLRTSRHYLAGRMFELNID